MIHWSYVCGWNAIRVRLHFFLCLESKIGTTYNMGSLHPAPRPLPIKSETRSTYLWISRHICRFHGSNPQTQILCFGCNYTQEGEMRSNIFRTENITAWHQPSEKFTSSHVWITTQWHRQGAPAGLHQPLRKVSMMHIWWAVQEKKREKITRQGRDEGTVTHVTASPSSMTFSTAPPTSFLRPIAKALPGQTHPSGCSFCHLPADKQPI